MSFSKKTIILIIVFVSLSVASIIYLVTRTSKVPPTTQEPTSTSIESKFHLDLPGVQIGESVPFPDLPARLPIYKSQPAGLTLNQIAQNVAKQLNLAQVVNGPITYWTSDDHLKNLTVDPVNKIINYKIGFESNSPFYKNKPSLPLEKLAANAKVFVSSIGIDPDANLVADLNKVQYLSVVDVHSVATTADKANVIGIPFQYQLDGINLFTGTQTNPSVNVFFGSDNLIVQINAYTTSLFKFEKLNSVSAKSFDELKADVKAGNFQIINVYTAQPQITDPKLFKDLLISKIDIQYRVNAANSQAAPYFLLTGSQNGTEITLVVPAFKS